MAAPPDPLSPDQQAALDHKRERDRFQRQFDILLVVLVLVGLLAAVSYGASAGTCPPDPQQIGGPTTRSEAPTQQSQSQPPATQPAGGATENIGDTSENTSGAAENASSAAENVSGASENASGTSANRKVTRPSSTRPALMRSRCEDAGSGFAGALLALLIALAALAVGTFIGFLFGLPRTLTSSDAGAGTQEAAGSAAQANAAAQDRQDGDRGRETPVRTPGPRSGSEVNTNLEKISDWLTTIIVGVGLTKLEDVPQGLDSFGENVALYFGYGGKIFGIAGGIFFLIAGFFLSYVGTRVKLSLVFIWSQRTNLGAGMMPSAVRKSGSVSPLDPSALAPAVAGVTTKVETDLKKADAQMLSRNLTELNSPQELAAYANAAAREGRASLAADIFADLVKQTKDPAILSDYAGVLGLAGDPEGAQKVVESLGVTAPDAQQEAQNKAYVGRLRGGLYSRNYDDSIAAGEELIKQPVYDRDPWIHIWLACAYGQRHRDLKATEASAADLDPTRQQVVREVQRVVAIDPGLKSFVRTLYDPALVIGADSDLTSLYGDPDLEGLLAEAPPTEATPVARAEGEPRGSGEEGAGRPAEER